MQNFTVSLGFEGRQVWVQGLILSQYWLEVILRSCHHSKPWCHYPLNGDNSTYFTGLLGAFREITCVYMLSKVEGSCRNVCWGCLGEIIISDCNFTINSWWAALELQLKFSNQRAQAYSILPSHLFSSSANCEFTDYFREKAACLQQSLY